MKGSTLAEIIIVIGLLLVIYASFLLNTILGIFVTGFTLIGFGILLFMVYMKEITREGGG